MKEPVMDEKKDEEIEAEEEEEELGRLLALMTACTYNTRSLVTQKHMEAYRTEQTQLKYLDPIL